MDEKNNKKAYLIIGICCVVALVIGLFTGKTISDKARYDAALAYIESAQQNQVVEADNSGDNEVSEVSDASVTAWPCFHRFQREPFHLRSTDLPSPGCMRLFPQ